MGKLVYGVGVCDKGKHIACIAGKKTKVYSVWSDMLRRCCSQKFKDKWPTYADCCVSENFKSFQYFAEWCSYQVGFGVKGYALDKDILFRGNKIYSEDTCVFIPHEVNSVLSMCNSSRGKYPTGVTYSALFGEYRARVAIQGKGTHIGSYKTAEEAFTAYRVSKMANIKDVAERHRNSIDQRVYRALLEYEV